jgi:hypothetical protein
LVGKIWPSVFLNWAGLYQVGPAYEPAQMGKIEALYTAAVQDRRVRRSRSRRQEKMRFDLLG